MSLVQAEPAGVMRLVFMNGLRLAGAGVAAGVVGGLLAARLLENELFGVSARDPIAFGVAPAALILAGAAACYWPARRALLLSPVMAIRTQ